MRIAYDSIDSIVLLIFFCRFVAGNEGDVDTYTDIMTMPGSRLSVSITRDEIHREFARAMSERLVHAAIMAGAKDNITATVVLLPGCGL